MSKLLSAIKVDFSLLFKSSKKLSDAEKKRKSKAIWRVSGLFLVFIQLLISIIFMGLLMYLNIVPDKYMIMAIVLLILITAYNVVSQFTNSHIIGKILAVFLSIVLFTGSLYVAQANSMLGAITGTTTKVDTIDIIVLKTNNASSLKDVLEADFGYNSTLEKVNCEKALTQIMTDNKCTVNSEEYDSWANLFNGLYNGDVEVIIMSDATHSTLVEEFTDFESRTKIIDQVQVTTKITLNTKDKKVNEETFTMYISGNDEYGELTESGRSDVNIIATFNPKTRNVLLITTPRDYYIPLTSSSGTVGFDKLTHAGNFGVDGSITALNNLYGINIDYYLKVNFTGAVGIVDALDGITVNSEVDFKTSPDTSPIQYHFTVGENECDGEMALAFCRERQTFSNGDNQRGRNQMIAIQGIINKATSPAILANYTNVLNSINGMFTTSMPMDNITSLIKGQLDNPSAWTVQSYNVSGTGSSQSSYFFGLNGMSVILPDYNTVNIAIELMDKISKGDVFNVDEYVESINGKATTEKSTKPAASYPTPTYSEEETTEASTEASTEGSTNSTVTVPTLPGTATIPGATLPGTIPGATVAPNAVVPDATTPNAALPNTAIPVMPNTTFVPDSSATTTLPVVPDATTPVATLPVTP